MNSPSPVQASPASQPRAEPLTIAYVALGAMAAIRNMPEGRLPAACADRYGGEDGFMEEVVNEAWRLDEAADDIIERCNGLSNPFAFDYAKPFGERFARELALTPHSADAALIVADLFAGDMQSLEPCAVRP